MAGAGNIATLRLLPWPGESRCTHNSTLTIYAACGQANVNRLRQMRNDYRYRETLSMSKDVLAGADTAAPKDNVLDTILYTIQLSRERQSSTDEFELACHPCTDWMAIIGQPFGLRTTPNCRNSPLSICGVPICNRSSVPKGLVILTNLSAVERFRQTGNPESSMMVTIELRT